MACKPYSLIALWTDAIPPPGKTFKAHQIAMQTMKDKRKGPPKSNGRTTSVESVKNEMQQNGTEQIIKGKGLTITISDDDEMIKYQNTEIETFRTRRFKNIERRYQAFVYKYKELHTNYNH